MITEKQRKLVPRGKPSQEQCLVCKGKADGCHFDVDTCRACAAFFRRSVCRTGRSYSCKKEGKCRLQAGKPWCKACRYSICLKRGMRPDGVQPSRDAIGSKTGRIATPEVVLPSSSMPSPSSEPEMSILDRMEMFYEKVEADRRIIHGRESAVQKPEARYLTLQMANVVQVNDSHLVLRWIFETFPRLLQLPPQQMHHFFGNCFMPCSLVEACYYGGVTGDDVRSRLPSGDFINLLNPAHFFGQIGEDTFVSKEEACRMFSPTFTVFRRCLFIPIVRFRITKKERLALAAFLIWDTGHPMFPESLDAECRTVRDKVVEELYAVYKQEGRENPELRLATLLSFLPQFMKVSNEFRENVQIARIFNVYIVDSRFFELLDIK